jgi:hypothetical protein
LSSLLPLQQVDTEEGDEEEGDDELLPSSLILSHDDEGDAVVDVDDSDSDSVNDDDRL